MRQAILAALLRLAPHLSGEETAVEYQRRMDVLAESIDRASQGDKEVAAFLLMTGYAESRFLKRIHAGDCRAGECDNGKAVGPWQAWRLKELPQGQFDAMVGTGAAPTRLAAAYAARLYRMKRNFCGGQLSAINAYATGKCYGAKQFNASRRLRFMKRIETTLR